MYDLVKKGEVGTIIFFSALDFGYCEEISVYLLIKSSDSFIQLLFCIKE